MSDGRRPQRPFAASEGLRRLFRRGSGRRTAGAAAPTEQNRAHLSVLDCGTGGIKALIALPDARTIEILASAVEAAAPPASQRPPLGFEDLASRCERALIAVEDAAGVVPRRVVIGVDGREAVIARGHAEVHRRPGVPITADEVTPLAAAAEQAAAGAARLLAARYLGAQRSLEPLNRAALTATLDGRLVADAVGLAGAHLTLAVAAAYVPVETASRVRRLAGALDLELAGSIAMPFALGAVMGRSPDGPAIVVDVGAESTTAVAAGRSGAEAAVTFPIGGASLRDRLRTELGMDPPAAHEALVAHTLAAGPRTGAGAVAGRAVRRLAQHYAEVWLDAFELACGDLAARGTLPPRLLLCGGAAGLPELRRSLTGSGWQAGLPFERSPSVRLLTPADVPGVDDRSPGLPALQAVPPLCLAAAAAGHT